MSEASHFHVIEQHIRDATGGDFRISSTRSLGGGCINTAFQINNGRQSYFVKLNRKELLPMFEAEAEGLRELFSTDTVTVPEPLCCGHAGQHSYIVMEYLQLSSGKSQTLRLFGEQLARLHKLPQPYFGWQRDNTIGSTPQPNPRSDDWIEFWRDQRLGYQLRLAGRQGYSGKLQRAGEQLMERLPVFFPGIAVKPSLLHGDLWGGNFSSDTDGQPVMFDPACYYGHHEADLAMTELFGGFGSAFFDAYRNSYPCDPGYSIRKILYNLYHILNHLNLFGGGYLSQAEGMIERLLAETR